MLKLVCPNCGKVFFRTEGLARTVTACPACHARIAFNKEGKVALIKQVKYAREDPKYVRSLFNEMKQHGEPFRRRMQWLSRIYGGKGGYTSEELYKIVTGKTVGGYYIFPFVKGAPPEVNRILERTYRTHREAGDSKVAAAIAAWTKVKQAGYVKVTKPAPVWTKRRYTMEQLKPIQVVDYGIGTGMGGLTERGVRGLFGAARRHPRITRGVGTFGVGYLTAKELAKRRKRKKGYQLGLEHLTPDIPLNRVERLGKRLPTRAGVTRVGKRLGGTASMAVKATIVGLAATHLLHLLAKQQPRAPWLPEIRPDIELSGPGYETLDQVVQYAGVMSSPLLKSISTKTGAALHKTKVGVERGLLMWLLGFISAELLSRGITTPKRQHAVTFPDSHQLYKVKKKRKVAPWLRKKIRKKPLTAAVISGIIGGTLSQQQYVRELRPGEQMPLPVWGYHPAKPREFRPYKVPRISRRPRGARLKKVAKIGALPLAALLAIRLSKRGQEGYAFGPAAMKVGRGLKWGFKHPKVTKLLGKKAPLPARAGSFVRRRPGTVAGVGLGVLGVRELRKIRKQRAKQGYSFRSAASKTLRGLKKVGRGAGKVGKGVGWVGRKAYPVAITAMIASELWPKKKRRVGPRPPVQPQPYGLAKGLKRLLKLRKGKTPPVLGRKLRDLTLSRKDPALADLNKRLAAAAQKHKKHFSSQFNHYLFETKAGRAYVQSLLDSEVERYPFKSAAQRRWMHWKKPKMAKKWEEHTPEGADLPEHVSKHLLGIPVITPLVIAAILAKKKKKKKEKVSKHALSVPWAMQRARDLMRLKGAKSQGREVVQWARKLAKTLRTAQLKTTDVKRKVELGARAGKWETVADQVGDVIGRGQLEKVGLLAAATAAGAAGHEVGKKRERARVHRVIG